MAIICEIPDIYKIIRPVPTWLQIQSRLNGPGRSRVMSRKRCKPVDRKKIKAAHQQRRKCR